MAGKFNTWVRQQLAARIRSNGGYRSYRSETYPLSWTVRLYDRIDTAAQAQATLVAYGHYINEAEAALLAPDFEAWWEANGDITQNVHEWAQESVCDSLQDDEGFRTWSPGSARAVCMDYTGAGADRPFDMKLVQRGRGGKHVVLTAFEGISFASYTNEELAEVVENAAPSDPYVMHVRNVWCRQLLGMVLELDKMLTDKAAKEEYIHQYGYYLSQQLEEAYA